MSQPSPARPSFSLGRRLDPLARLVFVAAGAGLVAAASAQAPPESDPQLTDPSWREPLDPAPVAVDPLEPDPEAEPTATAPDYRIRPAPLLPEGSFLPRRRGTLVRSGSGEWVYVFHPDAQGEAERPMTLLPSATLERMEEVLARRNGRPQFILTGQVFVYNRTNYLLPTAFSIASPEPAAGPADDEPEGVSEAAGDESPGGAAQSEQATSGQQPAAEPSGAPADPPDPAQSELDAAVEDLIEQIQAERPGARALGESSMLAEVTRAASRADTGARPRPDGALLIRRRARLTRQAGAWRLTIDNDTDAAGDYQTTMVLLPCLNLQRMETLAADRGENQAFEVSGMVTQYRGRNFLVPTVYRVSRGGDVRPLQ